MTKEEKLNILNENIRKEIPRLMQLEEGCLIEGEFLTIFGIWKITGVRTFDNGCVYSLIINKENSVVKTHMFSFELERIKIIGKEPMLNDVLLWIKHHSNLVRDSKSMLISFDGNLVLYDYGLDSTHILKEHWDLSKIYLKDQNNDTINLLYSILTNNQHEK